MEHEKQPPEYKTIKAAVAGELWAVEQVVEHYSDEIDGYCKRRVKQPDGSIAEVIDEDMRQTLIEKLIASLPDFEA